MKYECPTCNQIDFDLLLANGTIAALRAALAEATAERESLQRQWQRDHDEMSARRKNAEARLAAALRRAEAAEAKFAAVRELCEAARPHAYLYPGTVLAVIGGDRG